MMKIALASMLLSAASAATHPLPKSKLPIGPLTGQSRRLDQNGDDQAAQEEEFAFLQYYEQVFLKCIPGEKSQNEQGEWEYSSVVYRLCPAGESCDSKGRVCSEGYGDYMVGLETYTRAFFDQFERQQNQNGQNNQDDANDFNFAEFGECKELNYDANDDGNGNQVQYFVGPGCTEDGDVKLTLYTDQYCRPEYESVDVTFEDLTGFELPYANGIGAMDDDECKAYFCYAQNENGEYELNEFCMETYQSSSSKCEEGMEYTGYYGTNTGGCEYISALMPAPSGNGGMWFLFALLIAAVAGFGIWFFLQQKKKANSAVSSDGLMM